MLQLGSQASGGDVSRCVFLRALAGKRFHQLVLAVIPKQHHMSTEALLAASIQLLS